MLLFSCQVMSLCDPKDCSMPHFPDLHYLSLLRFMSIESMMPSHHLILSCPLLLLPSIFPSIRVFSRELALHIKWPKYWRFMHWRRKWQPTPVFLPGESQGRGAWLAAIYGVAQSRTRLKRLSSSSSMPIFGGSLLFLHQ